MRSNSVRHVLVSIATLFGLSLTVCGEMIDAADVVATCTSDPVEIDAREEYDDYAALGGDGVEVVGDVDYDGDVTWTADKTWLVTGVVRVMGGTLTIEPGTKVMLGVDSGIRQAGGTVVSSGVEFSNLCIDDVIAFATSPSAVVDTRKEYDSYAALGGDGVEVVGDVDYDGDVTWTSDKTWIVTGVVRVKGGTLTIEPGTKVMLGVDSGIRQAGGTVVSSGVEFSNLCIDDVIAFATSPSVVVDTRKEYDAYSGLGGDAVEVVGDVDYGDDVTWTADKTWIVTGVVRVKGGTLTIEPGTKVMLGVDSGIRQAGGAVVSSGAVFSNLCVDDVIAFATSPRAEVDAREEHDAYAALGGDGVEVVGDVDYDGYVTWTADKTWIVTGVVRVKGGTLTIEPGSKVMLGVDSGIRQAGGAVVAQGVSFCNLSFDGRMEYGESEGDTIPVDANVGVLRIANESESLTYSSEWGESAASDVVISVESAYGESDIAVDVHGPTEGAYIWEASKPGFYTWSHSAGGETLKAKFAVIDTDSVSTVGEVQLLQEAVWSKEKVILVAGIVTVKSGVTLTIEPGAVVKFMDGAGIVCETGGRCIADGVIFTHVNDDTVGGDTLLDGSTSPLADMYVLNGVSGDDATQYRYHPDPTVTLSGTITKNEIWRGFNVYCVTGDVTVASGATLTIESGAIIKFDTGLSLTVNSGATLNAIGTRAEPIIFTSIKDDEYGGDTNNDGGKTRPYPGEWMKIGVNGGAVNFEYAHILYSSRNEMTGAINMNGGTVVFNNGEIAHCAYDAVGVESGNFYITNSIIHDCLLAFRHWARDPIVNCVIYDCGRLTQGGGQHFYNCIFSHIIETWEAFGFPQNGTTYNNCCFWNEGGSVLTGDGNQDAITVCGKDGNIWGNPLFLDPVSGDFRLADKSPCVDVADAAYAPEKDYFGQPRVNAPDIGICEYIPRGTTSDIDLVPQSVTADAEGISGQILTVNWTVANNGGADVNESWHDAISLVSASGREVMLGEKISSKRLVAGGTISCSAVFSVPAIAEGTWFPKVNVNSSHEIFEGALGNNNAMTGETAVNVLVNTVDLSIANDGVINAGTPTVLKLAFDETNENRMVKFDVPSGVAVTWGFGFMPQGALKSGLMTASGSGVMFRVPDEARDVYVVLESDHTAGYELFTESAKMVISGVTPSVLPSSGVSSVLINGAGFYEGIAISFVSNASQVIPVDVCLISAEQLLVDLDCAKLKADESYDLLIDINGRVEVLENAVSVKTEEQPRFWCKLNAPETVRQGRSYVCSIEYGNSGNVGMLSPVFTVTLSNTGGGVALSTSDLLHNELVCYGAGSSEVAGELLPGSSHEIRFIYTAGRSADELVLYSSYGKNFFPTNWPNENIYHTCLSRAAKRLALRNEKIDNYTDVLELARKIRDGKNETTVWGVLQDATITSLSGTMVSISNTIDTTVKTVVADKEGVFRFSDVYAGDWVAWLGEGMFSQQCKVIDNSDLRVDFSVGAMTPSVVVLYHDSPNGCDSLEALDGGVHYSLLSSESALFYMCEKGTYRLVHTDCNGVVQKGERFEYCGNTVFVEEIPICGQVTNFIVNVETASCVFAVKTDEATLYYAEQEAASRWGFNNIPQGDYVVFTLDDNGNCLRYIDNTSASLVAKSAQQPIVMMSSALARSSLLASSYQYIDFDFSQYSQLDLDRVCGELTRAMGYVRNIPPRPGDPGEFLPNDNCNAGHKPCYCIRDQFYEAYKLLYDLERSLDQTRNLFDYYKELSDSSWWCWWLFTGSDICESFAGIICETYFPESIVGPIIYDALYEWAKHSLASDVGVEVWVDLFVNEAMAHGLNAMDINKIGLSRLYEECMRRKDSNKWAALHQRARFLSEMQRLYNSYLKTYRRYMEWWRRLDKLDFLCNCSTEDIPVPNPEEDRCEPTLKKSKDPNEMSGPIGLGNSDTERFVKPGEVLTYTVYFENKSDATAAAQEVYVTNPLSEWLDWSSFEMGEVVFNNQIDLGLSGKPYGTSEATMNGTNFIVRTMLGGGVDGTGEIASQGVAHWYMRIVDPTTGTGWPEDITAGFLPPNDETFRGEGHLTYRIKVRDDAPQNVVITNSATIVFDYNDPIETDPAWWNTVAPTIGTAQFAEQDVVEDEGSNIVVRIKGGNLYTDSSVKLYLSYNTAAAADLDLAKGAIDGVTPKGGLKFPLALSWETGELVEKVITIPVKADKAVEDDEFFTLQLGAPVGMELGDATICTVTIRDPGYDELRDRINAGTATKAESNTWTKVSHEGIHYIRGLADPANAGKVTGSGYCADGKKVTLKATANKGFVFMDWCDAAGSRVATNATLVVDRTAKPAASSATSTTLTGVNEDATYYAKFITIEEDRASITLALGSEELDASTVLETNVTCGVALEWPLASYALSATTVKVAGLPAGLKFAAKDVLDSKTKQVTVKANTIYGAPTAASKVDAKKGVVPSDVKITVTTAGKSSVTYLVKLTVDPLPAWAVGTFDGEVESGGIVQAFTVATSGKISGKVLEGGMTWALSAPNFSRAEYAEGGPEPEVPSPSFFATVIGKAGKEVVTNEVEVAGAMVQGVEVGVASSDSWSAWQNLWSRPDTKAEMPVFRKSFDVTLESGLKLTFKKNGAVSFAGKVEGVGVSGSSQLVCGDNGWQVTLYAPPKGAFKGFSDTFAVILTFDEANAVTDVEVAEWQ